MNKEVSRRNVTCPLFVATDETLTEMWCETQARDADRTLRKITYKGRKFFVDHEALCDLIGYDPDVAI